MAGLALWSALLAIKDGRFADRILAGANLTIAIWLMQQ